jgi:hypothetical protein
MILIRKGFDGLDIAFPLTVGCEVAEKLRLAKEDAESNRNGGGLVYHNGLIMNVASSGIGGGYAYAGDTDAGGPFGEKWFFKRPTNSKDKWGVRVSCKSLPLALDGLAKVREKIETTLAFLELNYEVGTESIGRVDFALDYFVPNLNPNRHHFVAHSRSRVREVTDAEVQTDGRPGRVETVTVGKNPGRQIVLYDKRAEIIDNNKVYWLNVWNDALARQGLPVLDMSDRARSEVWRIEFRAYKKHLKNRWNITTWGNLRAELPKLLTKALDDIRFAVPNADTNRARWPDHPLWNMTREALGDDLEGLHSMADQNEIRELLRVERDEMLEDQIKGCMISRAALNGVSDQKFWDYIQRSSYRIVRDMKRSGDRTSKKLTSARAKYAF